MSAETLPGPAPTDPHAEHRRPLPAGAPSHIGRYEVLREIGAGTFGRVYYAHDPRLRRYVAVKVPKDPLPADRHDDFLREARLIVELAHKHICPVYDADVSAETPFIVMRFVAETLDDVLKRGPIPPERASAFALQIARALEAAHTKGVIHRDLKPTNLLYDVGTDALLLTDFGIARVLDSATVTSGSSKGTPLYMAPEQWEPDGEFGKISVRTDVYSLGCLLFQMLVGKPPFEGSQFQLLNQHMRKVPQLVSKARAGLTTDFDALCSRAMEKLQEHRFASAGEFARALTPSGEPIAERAVRGSAAVALPAVSPLAGQTREVEIAPEVRAVFCWIPAGECQLGSPEAERARAGGELSAEAEQTRGAFRTNGFWLAKFPVTQVQWAAVMRGTEIAEPSWFRAGGEGAFRLDGISQTGEFPVERVSYMNCQKFIRRVNEYDGFRAAFGGKVALDLPHEDEWEYACRGALGNTYPFYFGPELNGEQANCDGNDPFGTRQKGPSLQRTQRVGSYESHFPHPWGLCDLHGNVWEWCRDSENGAAGRVVRGGSWGNSGRSCRAAFRLRLEPVRRSYLVGMRMMLVLS